MTEKYVLATDQNTQGTKAILVDHRNQTFWKNSLPHKRIINEDGWVGHDLNEIRANLTTLFRQVLKKVTADQIESLAITNQREFAAVWSRKTDEPLRRTTVWQDNRAERLINRTSYPELTNKAKNGTGLALSLYSTGAR